MNLHPAGNIASLMQVMYPVLQLLTRQYETIKMVYLFLLLQQNNNSCGVLLLDTSLCQRGNFVI